MSKVTSDMAPTKAENTAWWEYRGAALKMGREVDERTFRDAWRQGCHFTFGATSQLSPAIAAFIDWMQYVTDWSRPGTDAEAETPTQARS